MALVAIKRRKSPSFDAPSMGNEWAMHKDPQSNRLYWHNPKTGETRWDDYAEYVDKASGKMYWHNTRTGETTWASPFAKNNKSENPLLNHGKTDSEFNNPLHAGKGLPNTKPSLRRRMSSSIRRKV